MRLSYLIPYLLILPIFFLIFLIVSYPITSVLITSFYKTRYGIKLDNFIGLENFFQLIKYPLFWLAIKNSIIWTIGNIILQLFISLSVGILLNQDIKGKTFFQTAVLIPWITPAVASAIIWRFMLEPTIGIINRLLLNLGLIKSPILFLGKADNAMLSVIFINSWMHAPIGILLVIAALQTIPKEILDATEMDISATWQKYRYVIFPLMISRIAFIGLLLFIWNFNAFTIIWLTTQGGPGDATTTLPVLVYRLGFRMFNAGQSAAISTLMALVSLIYGLLYFKYSERGEQYE
ncbi:MAG: sugar ABC transporter permease [Candidatus Methanomethylicaceae archaeon]